MNEIIKQFLLDKLNEITSKSLKKIEDAEVSIKSEKPDLTEITKTFTDFKAEVEAMKSEMLTKIDEMKIEEPKPVPVVKSVDEVKTELGKTIEEAIKKSGLNPADVSVKFEISENRKGGAPAEDVSEKSDAEENIDTSKLTIDEKKSIADEYIKNIFK